MRFAQKLRFLLIRRSKSQISLAALLECDITSIRGYLKGENIPRMDRALQIARALDCPLDWLADDSQGMDEWRQYDPPEL